jgi:GAF domain-containing protein
MTDRKDGRWDDVRTRLDPSLSDSADMSGEDPPTTRVNESQRVVLLDRVSSTALSDYAPRRSESAAGGVVIVATGSDGERLRKLCTKHGLLVPVMASLAVVHEAVSVVVIGEPSPPAPERVVHVVRSSMPDDELVDLLRALVTGHVIIEPPTAANDAATSDIARRLSAISDRGTLERTTCDAIVALVNADRAHCLFHEPSTGALWSEAKRRSGSDDRRAMGGLVGYAAHTGLPIEASPAGEDPRWLQELDDPDGKPQSRVLVQPIIGADRRVHAVLVAVRRWSSADFSARDKRALASFAALAASALDVGAAKSSPAPVPPPRPARTTMQGAGAKAAVVAAPRASTDSRPPPVTARGRTPSIPPLTPTSRVGVGTGTARAASALADETRVDPPPASEEERYSSESITSLPSPPAVARPKTPATPAPVVVEKPMATPVPAPPPRVRTEPLPNVERRVVPAPTNPETVRQHARPATEPRDLAVVVNADEAKRVDRIAKKARIELSTFGKLADAPDFYAIVTIGEAWSQASDARIAYAARTSITDDQLSDLLVGLSTRRSVVPAPKLARPQSAAEARRAQVAFAGARKLAAEPDLASAEARVAATMNELLDVDRAYCLFIDPDTGRLWSEQRRRAVGSDERRAIAGITGWCARTGRAVNVPHATTDPRYLAPLDDPDGDPHSQLLVQPLIRNDERVHGVLVAVRRPRRPGFTETDAALLARYAALATTQLEQLAAYVDTQAMTGDEMGAPPAMPDAPAPAPTDPMWLQIARGQHPLAPWLFLIVGVLVGALVAFVV